MMIKGISVLEIVKRTFLFVGNKKAMRPLFLSYFFVSVLIASFLEVFPFVKVQNNIAELNVYSVGAVFLLIVYFSILVVSRIMQYIFFDKEISQLYFVHPEKKDLNTTICLMKMFCSSVLCSYLAILLFSLLGQKFLHIPPLTEMGIVKYTFVFVPYFLILQCYRLPACIAGERVGFFRGFKKSNQFGMLLCVIYLIVSILPFIVVFSLFVKFQMNMFFSTMLSIFTGFISIHLQAAFMGYLYAILKDAH